MSESAGQWSPDPYGRAELRWYDGTAWTTHVSNQGVTGQAPTERLDPAFAPPPTPAAAPAYGYPGYAQQVPAYYAPVAAQVPGVGRLIAAGIMSIITGVVNLIAAIYLLSVINSDVGGFLNDVSGGVGTAVMLVLVAFGVMFIWFGVVGVQKKAWAKLAIAIAAGLCVLFVLIGLLGGDSDGSVVIPLAWFGTIFGLAVSYNPNATAAPRPY